MSDFQFKKQFGQNFIKNVPSEILAPLNQLQDASLQGIKDFLFVEIGPGSGNITYKVIDQIKFLPYRFTYLLIEIDDVLASTLERSLNDLSNVKYQIVNKDFLKFNILNFIDTVLHYRSTYPFGMYIFGALPYNISKQIILKVLRDSYEILHTFHNLYFLPYRFILQKEVAQHYASTVPSYDFLGVMLDLFVEYKKILRILKPGNFYPMPKVDSAILEFLLKPYGYRRFECLMLVSKYIKLLFNQKRKKVKNAASNIKLRQDDEQCFEIFQKYFKILRFSANLRPHEINWKQLVNHL